jgi:hypothetical protein
MLIPHGKFITPGGKIFADGARKIAFLPCTPHMIICELLVVL